jgi:hypothetical protein
MASHQTDHQRQLRKNIPANHPYIANYLQYQNELTGLGNAVRIAVDNPKGSIYDAAYLETLRQLSEKYSSFPASRATR